MELILTREVTTSKNITRVVLITAFVFAMAFGAYVRIPLGFTPVPLTLQTFFVLLSAAVLKNKWGPSVQLIYITLGLAGIPLFANSGSGTAYFFGPTGGYLIGFIVAALFLSQLLNEPVPAFRKILISMAFAEVIILSLGSIWLKAYTGLSLEKAFILGFVPFIAGDFIKVLSAALFFQVIKKRVREIL